MSAKRINRLISYMTTLIMAFMMLSLISTTTFGAGEGANLDGDVKEILINVVAVLLMVGGCACLGKLAQIGIMFMMSSAQEKSNAKTALIPWLVGTIVCFGASWIGPLIINIFKNNVPTNVLEY